MILIMLMIFPLTDAEREIRIMSRRVGHPAG